MKLKNLLLISLIFLFVLNLSAEIDIFLQSADTDLSQDQPLIVNVEITGLTEYMRAFAVTVEYNTGYFTATPSDFTESTFLSASGDPTQWEMAGTDGSYTATCAILGYTAGVTGSGTLFSFELTNLNQQNLTGTEINITGVVLRDTLNNEIYPDNVTGLTATINTDLYIFLTSPNTHLAQNENLYVNAEISGMAENLRSFALTISFDTYHFSASPEDFQEGTFLSASGDPTQWEMSGTDGSYTATCAILGYTTGVNGEGVLFSFELTNLNRQNLTGTEINIANVVLRDTLNNEIYPVNVSGLSVTIEAPEGVYLDVTLLLEGPWISGTSMRYDLETAGKLPLVSPYDGEVLSEFPEVSPQHIVDWIWLELRETENGATVDSCNAFLLDNAALVSTEGDQRFPFLGAGGNSYYLVVRHRNHLDIMTAIVHRMSGESSLPTVIDLTDVTNIYGDLGIKELETGIYGMISGDADRDRYVAPSDLNNVWRLQTGLSGYWSADFNLNKDVQPQDRNDYWRINTGKSSKVPTN
ncbi:MAG: hypothetical protein APR54_06750 [Candidatus Cloacimonas sp. SDB]|nr:MAG: hypothetical protein APR54_06750 [Candidatus Cloacimonas sp. SDB]